ncbi:M1 family metallopeptidase [Xanthovirga aplysinae]|uniref:M1 family metallopeptidase n=1 Tax=Xanthovirga aplysinae TaxID=2529853 RepID=UPI0012BB4C2A|nr:M1 family metallopeptidase [Xanthovirga aplysinae]MTI31955.1 M1 family peptidase [Xanthovirga aplysinae]
MRKNLLIILVTLFTVACQVEKGEQKPGPFILTIIDGSTLNSIEGAVIYAKEKKMAFRSDQNGTVLLPTEFADLEVSLEAKNHRTQKLRLTEKNALVKMVYDEALVNSVEAERVFERVDSLRGTYGPYRANNDLLYYDLQVKVDVEKKFISGRNQVSFKMLKEDDKIQLDLYKNLNIDKILLGKDVLTYKRDENAVFINFPEKLKKGEVYEVDFFYSGYPKASGRFGGLVFDTDSLGNPWIYTATQDVGSSIWWPSKDQQPDEVDSMRIRIAVPKGLTDVSNGRFVGKTELEDGYTEFEWKVHYPINNYSVSMNVAKYTHFSDQMGEVTMDYYVLPYHLEQAKLQFNQSRKMLESFQKHFGDYPFLKDGFKLIEVPYSGMEHQSAITYGNYFKNGYLGRDWTGVGVSTKFDFIIIHESAHEWFGNSITARDVSDAWIHEGWGTYAEAVFVEDQFGYEDGLKYINGYKSLIRNSAPIITPSGVYAWPSNDMYFKGALFLNTLRNVVDNDEQWWKFVREYCEHFKHKDIFVTDVLNYFNSKFDRDFKPLFDQYLYHSSLPILQLKFKNGGYEYRWKADVAAFDMPVKVKIGGIMETLQPSVDWKFEDHKGINKEQLHVATDLFYINVEEVGEDGNVIAVK